MATADRIGATHFSTPTDREVLISRTFDAPRTLLWEVWTDPKHVPQWMTGPEGWTMPVCEIDLRPAGSWHFVWRKANGTEMAMTGEYREVKPPERLVSTEKWGPEWPETINTVTFIEKGGRTTVDTTILYPSKEARDAALGTGMKDGSNISYDRLTDYLRSLK